MTFSDMPLPTLLHHYNTCIKFDLNPFSCSQVSVLPDMTSELSPLDAEIESVHLCIIIHTYTKFGENPITGSSVRATTEFLPKGTSDLAPLHPIIKPVDVYIIIHTSTKFDFAVLQLTW